MTTSLKPYQLDSNGPDWWEDPAVEPGHTHTSSAAFYSPLTYGAKADGATDDTVAWNACVAAIKLRGGGKFLTPNGNSVLTPVSATVAAVIFPSNVEIDGHGPQASIVTKNGNGLLFDFSGSATGVANHCRYGGIRHIGINGGGFSGALVRNYYADNFVYFDVFWYNNHDVVNDCAEFWDSRFIACRWENNGLYGAGTAPNIWLRNSAVASPGFGFSADNINQISFYGCRWEGFTNGAVAVQHGTGNVNNPNGVYFYGNKMETSSVVSGNHLLVDSSCTHVIVDGLYLYAGAFNAGSSTPITPLNFQAVGSSAVRNVEIANSGTATIADGASIFAGGITSIENVWGSYGTAPTDAHMTFTGGAGTIYLTNCPTNKGTQFSGTAPTGLVNSPTWTTVSV